MPLSSCRRWSATRSLLMTPTPADRTGSSSAMGRCASRRSHGRVVCTLPVTTGACTVSAPKTVSCSGNSVSLHPAARSWVTAGSSRRGPAGIPGGRREQALSDQPNHPFVFRLYDRRVALLSSVRPQLRQARRRIRGINLESVVLQQRRGVPAFRWGGLGGRLRPRHGR
jgi:hypothetical protein